MDLGERAASNDELGPAPRHSSLVTTPESTGGWDPFDVWRTRVRDARQDTRSP
jgi:hypothetical protein